MTCGPPWDQMHCFGCEGHLWEAEDLFSSVQALAGKGSRAVAVVARVAWCLCWRRC